MRPSELPLVKIDFYKSTGCVSGNQSLWRKVDQNGEDELRAKDDYR